MENISSSPFLVFWHTTMMIGAAIMAIAGVVIYVLHQVRISTIKDPKDKYDYINQREIKNYKLMFFCFGLCGAMIINLYGMGKLTQLGVWFLVRLFISIAGGTLVGYVAFLILDYYYPTVIARKLNKWRYTPRISNTGSAMRLLSEDEEDVHLAEGMQAEENIFSVDYDVWVDEQSQEIKVEKYSGHLQALKCNSCGFHTMKVLKEEITEQPSGDKPGELVKHYQCSYCKSVRATAFKISTKEPEDYRSLALKTNFRKNKNVDLIKVEVHSNTAGKKFFEFQTLDQAQRFLAEYDDKS